MMISYDIHWYHDLLRICMDSITTSYEISTIINRYYPFLTMIIHYYPLLSIINHYYPLLTISHK